MKRKSLCLLLVAEGIVLLLSHFLGDAVSGLFTSVLAFPFEQIGWGLGKLAALGAVGNGVALLLLAAIALLPMIPVLRHISDRSNRGENIALTVLTLVLLPVLYHMASPAAMQAMVPMSDEKMLSSLKMMLGGSAWSVAGCWLVLRMLRLFREGDRTKMLNYLHRMLCVMCAVFVGGIGFNCFGQMLSDIRAAQLPADTLMAILRFAVNSLPYAADIAVVFAGLSVLEKLTAEGVSEETVRAAEKLSRISGIGLAMVALSGAGLSLLQLTLVSGLSDLRTNVSIPVLSLAFVLAALLFSRLIADNKRLSDDNDLFI